MKGSKLQVHCGGGTKEDKVQLDVYREHKWHAATGPETTDPSGRSRCLSSPGGCKDDTGAAVPNIEKDPSGKSVAGMVESTKMDGAPLLLLPVADATVTIVSDCCSRKAQ